MPGISRRALLTSATALAVIPTAALASSTAPVSSSLPGLVALLHAAIAANVEADAAYDVAIIAFERAYLANPVRYSTSAGVLVLPLPRSDQSQRHIRLDGKDVSVPQAVLDADGKRRQDAANACSWSDDELRCEPALIAERRRIHAAAKVENAALLRADVSALEAARAEYLSRHDAAVGEVSTASDAGIYAEWEARAAFYAFPCTTDAERRMKVDALMTIDGDRLEELATGPDDQRNSSLAIFIRSLCGSKGEA
jgi:hypothetical protein